MNQHCSVERIVIHYIGAFALMGLCGLIWLVNSGKTPEGHIVALVGVVSAAIGGLVGMLTNLARRPHDEPTSVIVENTSSEPVPVEET